jgi:thymidylate synthase
MANILADGVNHEDRTGVGRRSIHGVMMKIDLSGGKMPIVTTRKVNPEAPVKEMLMFIDGSTTPHEHGVRFWDQWLPGEADFEAYVVQEMKFHYGDDWEVKAKEDPNYEQHKAGMIAKLRDAFSGQIGPMYGHQWRFWPIGVGFDGKSPRKPVKGDPRKLIASDRLANFKTSMPDVVFPEDPNEPMEVVWSEVYVDQLHELVTNLKERPFSSRHVISTWNPTYIPEETVSPGLNVLNGRGCLAPCHIMVQVHVVDPKEEGGKKRLRLQLFCRSQDYPVGTVFNIAQYAALAHMLAHVTDMEADELIYMGGDVHLYLNQLEIAPSQLAREPLPSPTIWINPEVKDIFQLKLADIRIDGYSFHPDDVENPIKYPVTK